jgi:flagellar protein FliO/FliZ
MNGLQTIGSVIAVAALLGACVWALRRGVLQLPGTGSRAAIVVETATSLGERRSLAIVRVEQRRLLIGLTPGAVSFIADLAAQPESSPSRANPS